MAMKNPPHPGRLLRADIDALGMSVAEAAKGLGVTRQQLYNVLNGRSAISPDMAIRLEKGVGSSAETWLNLQTAFDLALARARTADVKLERLASKQVPANHPVP
jgi:addiction module HigA family antidote